MLSWGCAHRTPDCRQRKLCLVLDLDHTLINSAFFPEIEPSTLAALEQRLHAEASLPEAARTLFRLPHIAMWTKLRPGARAFLAKAASQFQLWIHTNSARSVASGRVPASPSAHVTRCTPLQVICDCYRAAAGPHRRAVWHAHHCQGVSGGRERAADGEAPHAGACALPAVQLYDAQVVPTCLCKQGLEQLETVALVLDDSSSVWQLHKASLLTVERYVFFPSSRRSLGISSSYFEMQRCDLPCSLGCCGASELAF